MKSWAKQKNTKTKKKIKVTKNSKIFSWLKLLKKCFSFCHPLKYPYISFNLTKGKKTSPISPLNRVSIWLVRQIRHNIISFILLSAIPPCGQPIELTMSLLLLGCFTIRKLRYFYATWVRLVCNVRSLFVKDCKWRMSLNK